MSSKKKKLPFTSVLQAVNAGFGIFKHTASGKFSARRSLSGILVMAATADMANKGEISINALILSFIAILPLIALSLKK
tara:strand:+ start:6998 stop:7234 length:237 start_codon:yes stop_codon:yes gene_type:complete